MNRYYQPETYSPPTPNQHNEPWLRIMISTWGAIALEELELEGVRIRGRSDFGRTPI
ncbi:hypothetical protein [Planktothricoides raciborskii]|uniref:Uncharacterized protein n=1 Tax=Planktothricoides raciborskii GIHE-MW2 TaxID=2792601 RepID=A0AAU8J7N5_9CYAN